MPYTLRNISEVVTVVNTGIEEHNGCPNTHLLVTLKMLGAVGVLFSVSFFTFKL